MGRNSHESRCKNHNFQALAKFQVTQHAFFMNLLKRHQQNPRSIYNFRCVFLLCCIVLLGLMDKIPAIIFDLQKVSQ